MAFLVDTSVLVRLANRADKDYSVADRAVVELHRRGETLHISPQNLVEFRSVATRPLAVNGLGFDTTATEAKAADFEAVFSLMPETPSIYPAWKVLVAAAGIISKRVHDARLLAICHVHGISHLLTFNTADFTPWAALGPGIYSRG